MAIFLFHTVRLDRSFGNHQDHLNPEAVPSPSSPPCATQQSPRTILLHPKALEPPLLRGRATCRFQTPKVKGRNKEQSTLCGIFKKIKCSVERWDFQKEFERRDPGHYGDFPLPHRLSSSVDQRSPI
ncbi:hypothetical protein B9Z55_008221 [Caenorhabditis nigoni]|uniref:Uncharacterized protein n=1 Tax=Caenorhabditis nigoni TaxID=1611254 RepID=A0A2G5VD73_9PELO|nr:hypothetical protein B9Z55_008221 [Caenorhabditis nigoni]